MTKFEEDFVKKAVECLLRVAKNLLFDGYPKEKIVDSLEHHQQSFNAYYYLDPNSDRIGWNLGSAYFWTWMNFNAFYSCGDETAPHVDDPDKLLGEVSKLVIEGL